MFNHLRIDSIFVRGLFGLVAALSVLLTQVRAGEPVGAVHVERDDVAVPVPDQDYVFKVGNTAHLFQLKNDALIVFHPVEGAQDSLYAVRWNKYDAPAWISNERLVTFGKIVKTCEGSLLLERDEVLPVVAIGQRDFRVLIQRFGNTATLDIRRDTPGLRFEERKAVVQVPPVTQTNIVVQGAPTSVPVAIIRSNVHTVIEGNGSMLTMRTNADEPARPVQIVTQHENVVAAPPPVTQPPPVAPPAIASVTNTESASVPTSASPQMMLPTGMHWPSLIEDRGNLIVIGVFLALLFVLLQIQRRFRRSRALATQPQTAGAEPAVLRSKSRGVSPGAGATDDFNAEPQKLRFVSSKKNQTVILGQQNLVGSPVPGMPMSASDTSIIPSQTIMPDRRNGGVLWIGKYQVEQLLGRGRMGVVYKAFQQDLNRSVALKLLAEGGHASQKQKELFVKEAQAIAKLRHPNIVTVYEVGEWEGQPFFTMDFVDGKSMDKMIVKQRFPPMETARLAKAIAEAVEYAHSNGIIHRDLKPGNIILNNKGEPVITDFGLARHLDEETQSAGDDILGTPAYMSPEQARGRTAETDARSDVYSLGAILYAMLTGDDPFTGSSLLEILHKVIHDKPTPPDKIDPQIDIAISAICMKALSKDPKKRHQSAGDLAADLARYLQVLASAAVPEPTPAGRTGILSRLFARRTE